MKNSYKKLVVEKGIDLSIVVFGILIALSFNSYRDSKRMLNQWGTFKEQLKTNIKDEIKNLNDDLKQYEKSIAEAKAISNSIAGNDLDLKRISLYLESMGTFYISMPRTSNYKAFLKLNNSYLTKNYATFTKIDNYFSYKETAQIYLDIYLEQVTPDIRRHLKEYRIFDSTKERLFSNKLFLHDTIFLIRSLSGLQGALSLKVKDHIKESEDLLKIIN